MLLVAAKPPEGPGKPLLLGFGCRLRGDTLSCEALYVGADIPPQSLFGELIERGVSPRRVVLDWSPLAPALWRDATITVKETE